MGTIMEQPELTGHQQIVRLILHPLLCVFHHMGGDMLPVSWWKYWQNLIPLAGCQFSKNTSAATDQKELHLALPPHDLLMTFTLPLGNSHACLKPGPQSSGFSCIWERARAFFQCHQELWIIFVDRNFISGHQILMDYQTNCPNKSSLLSSPFLMQNYVDWLLLQLVQLWFLSS